jgi:hypothetical protein
MSVVEERGRTGRGLAPDVRARLAPYPDLFARDGAIHIPQALSVGDLATARQLFDWSCAHPGQAAQHLRLHGDEFFFDTHNMAARDIYREKMAQSTLPAIAAAATGIDALWYMGEQIFFKQGAPNTSASDWHQDTTYFPVSEVGGISMWIPFDSMDEEHGLCFVRGSHLGPIYNPFHAPQGSDGEPIPLFPESSGMPPFPDIEAHPEDFDLVSWACEPGDVILFHTSALHGRAPVPPSGLRRALCLRFVGPEVKYEFRKGREKTGILSFEATEYIWEDLKEDMPVHEGKYFFKVFENAPA